MKKTWPYIPSVKSSTESKLDVDLMEKSTELFEEGDYIGSLHTLIDALDSTYREKYGNKEGNSFHIPHGSIIVDINISDDELLISTDFLELPEKGRVAMLREIANLNIKALLLVGFVKEGNTLKIQYKTPLYLSHPDKIYNILKDTCIIGDRYDDEFCTKFNAKRCYEPRVTPYSTEEIERIHKGIEAVAGAAIENSNKFVADRSYSYASAVLSIALYQIQYFANFQGQLMNDIINIIDDVEDRAITDIIDRRITFLKKLLAMSPEELAKDLYHVDILISSNYRSSLQNLQQNMVDSFKEANGEIQLGDYEPATLRLLLILYKAFYYCDIPNSIAKPFAKALEESAEKPLKEAAQILSDVLEALLDGEIGEDEEEDGIGQVDMSSLNEALAQNQAAIASAFESYNTQEVQELQQKMMQAMSNGDMAEYTRLAMELQQKMMNLYNNQ